MITERSTSFTTNKSDNMCGKKHERTPEDNGSYFPNMNYKKVVTFANGEKYEEEFKDNECNGHLVLTLANENKYVGEYTENGEGVLFYPNGDEYKGEFQNNKRHGKGVYTFANGDKYEGEFNNNEFNGLGVLTYANGDKYKGKFKDGKRYGKGVMTYANKDDDWRDQIIDDFDNMFIEEGVYFQADKMEVWFTQSFN